jgi:hypothetical protein
MYVDDSSGSGTCIPPSIGTTDSTSLACFRAYSQLGHSYEVGECPAVIIAFLFFYRCICPL